MHTAATEEPSRRAGFPLLACGLSLACVLLMPPLSLPMTLAMPLIICPLRASGGRWLPLLLPLIPCAGLFLMGIPPIYVIALLSFSYFSLIAALLVRGRRPDLVTAALWHSLAMLLSFALLCGGAALRFGGDLLHGLSEAVTETVAVRPQGNAFLFSLTRAGLLAFPPRLEQAAALTGPGILLLPQVKTELLNAFRYLLYDLFRQRIPPLLVRISLTVGLFTALLTARKAGRGHPASVTVVCRGAKGTMNSRKLSLPSFEAFFLPPEYRMRLFALALFTLLLACAGSGEVAFSVHAMAYAVLTTVYVLLGGAAWVFLLCRKAPGRRVWAGVSAGMMMLLCPDVLLLLGLADQFLHLRASALLTKEIKEE